ncbi:2-hydroxyacyl-CoA dehydratase subunit D [Desulfospira joergensenii]|uniref:2-hydroxyacyl-CoA dehydratase subunit D n=1 Tax=Desulfospira joergensenii TaxID=53329 RepID=UPI0003B36E66|nr:2-hydroxyacyl-CoA dehydratase family protein [Desulfospira joergensenii]
MISDKSELSPRQKRLLQKTRNRMSGECRDVIDSIKNRDDYAPGLAPFLKILEQTLFPEEFTTALSQKSVYTLCVQAPLELFRAAGVRPFKLACGSHAALEAAPLHLPALTCPMIKSVLGLLQLESKTSPTRCVIPTTCDWVVKFKELAGLNERADIHYLELPHLRETESASRRWLNQVYGLKAWLETVTGRKIKPGDIYEAICSYAGAYEVFCRLIELRRAQSLPGLSFALMANALAYMDVDQWTACVKEYMLDLKEPAPPKTPVFLTGSPILFPNYKLLFLIEKAGMAVVADDLCSMERSIPGALTWEDRSEYALLRALAERNHKACICPTFADNQRRFNSLVHTLEQSRIKGIIFHVLKGCHPFDIESGILELQLKAKGIRFLKIETDYVREDEQNIVTRLEAFSRTLSL